jgi:hypothetical protein
MLPYGVFLVRTAADRQPFFQHRQLDNAQEFLVTGAILFLLGILLRAACKRRSTGETSGPDERAGHDTSCGPQGTPSDNDTRD